MVQKYKYAQEEEEARLASVHGIADVVTKLCRGALGGVALLFLHTKLECRAGIKDEDRRRRQELKTIEGYVPD